MEEQHERKLAIFVNHNSQYNKQKLFMKLKY